jgi:hypothetical protein
MTSLTTIIIIILLLIISGISKAAQDKLNFHFERSIFKNKSNWWNTSVSWKNKYNWFPNSKILTWLISNPLVAITDAWHFFGLLRDFSIFACIPIISGNYWLFLLYPVYRFVFHVFFTYIFEKKE